ncbi:MAG TPA: FAD-dependent oxidoreductase [Noviherbaspirillum sp.]|nr:FAD-dependent oxidoreductase [Noviherbaspirillum sp.]
MQPSFWEQDAMLDADFIVVGGGLLGLQTALELRARRPHASIRVLERGVLPCGASSRNAGFACFGSLTELLHDFDAMGEDAAVALVAQRWRGLQRLRARLGDAAIGYEALGGFELLFEADLPALQRLDHVNACLKPVFGREPFSVDAVALRRAAFGPRAHALVVNPLEGQLHSGLLMQALGRLAAQQDIRLHTGVAVEALEETGGGVRVHVSQGVAFSTSCVALCINGFSRDLLPDAGIVPARGQVLVTEPIPGLPWRGCYHLDRGYYYFRNVGERVLLGGARHLCMDQETTTELALTDTVQHALEALLHATVLPGRMVRIAQRWAGIMGFSADKQPIVRRVSERVVLGFCCNGMGVALGPEVATQTAQLLT